MRDSDSGQKAGAKQHVCIYDNCHQGTMGTTAQLIYMREDEREKGEGEGRGREVKGERESEGSRGQEMESGGRDRGGRGRGGEREDRELLNQGTSGCSAT